MAIVINEMEVVPIEATAAPTAPTQAAPATRTTVRLADLARAERRLQERAARVRAQ